jgi:CBS domain containing-hemolysin-like protein
VDLADALGLGAIAALVLANGFFVATELSIVAARRSRLDQLIGEGNAAARAARGVVGRLDAYIAACQFGITMASIGLGWLAEPVLDKLLRPPLEALLGQLAHV